MSDYSFCETLFLNVQYKPTLLQSEAIPSCSIANYLEEEPNTNLSTISLQIVVESDVM